MSRISETDLIPTALDLIKARPGIRNDTKFSQKVRNLKSHDTIENQTYTVGERNRKWYIK